MSVDRLAPDRGVSRRDPRRSDRAGHQARLRKRPEEIALHAEAARITDLMLRRPGPLVEDAVAAGGELPTEAELAAHVATVGTSTMYAEHEDVVVVGFLAGGLVYAGANSARPHALPSGYRLRPGDTFMLSLGCAVGGRFVEGERTFILGEPTADQRRYYEAVRQAQQTGARRCGPAGPAPDVTALPGRDPRGRTRRVPAPPAGPRHRARHARAAVAVRRRRHRARDRHVVSNEPGIYIPGHAGYRISDSMLVTEDGGSRSPRTPVPRRHRDRALIHRPSEEVTRVGYHQRQRTRGRGLRPGRRPRADRPPRRARARLPRRAASHLPAVLPTRSASSSSTRAAPGSARATARSPTSSGWPMSTACASGPGSSGS